MTPFFRFTFMNAPHLFKHPYLLFLALCVPVVLLTVWTGDQPFDVQLTDVYFTTSLFELSRWIIVGLAGTAAIYSISSRFRWNTYQAFSSYHFYFTALGVLGILFSFLLGLDHFHRPGVLGLFGNALPEYGFSLGQQPVYLDGFDWYAQTYFNRLFKVFGFIILMGQVSFALNMLRAVLKKDR